MSDTNNPFFKVIVPHLSCLIYQQLGEVEVDPLTDAMNQGYVEIYIMTPTGIYKHHKLRGTNRFIRTKVETVPGLAFTPLKEELSFLPAGKIPYTMLEQVEAFFREVIKAKGTAVEAMIWILWNEAQGYHLFVPNQTVSKASARYDWDGVPQGSSIVVDIHSHADFNAFFSGTDNADDSNSIRYSGVIGHNDKPVRSYAWRFNYRDKKFEAKVEDLFEMPQPAAMDVPKEWIDNVKTYSYTPGGGRPIHQGGTQVANGKWYSGYEMGNGYMGPDYDDPHPPVGASGRGGKSYTAYGPDWWKNSQQNKGGKPTQLALPGTTPAGKDAQGNNPAWSPQETFAQEFERMTGKASKAEKREQRAAAKKADGSPAEDRAGEPLIGGVGGGFVDFSGEVDGWGSVQSFGFGKDDAHEARANDELTRLRTHLGGEEVSDDSPVSDAGDLVVDKMTDLVVCAVTSAQTNPRFDEIVCNRGIETATAFCVINDLMPSVDGNDDLVTELVADLSGMMSGEKRASLLRSIYHSLPESERDKIATNGL